LLVFVSEHSCITHSGTSPCFARRPQACSILVSRAYRASERVLFVYSSHHETSSSDCLSNHGTCSFAYLRVCVYTTLVYLNETVVQLFVAIQLALLQQSLYKVGLNQQQQTEILSLCITVHEVKTGC
jgi:hypothetical protein